MTGPAAEWRRFIVTAASCAAVLALLGVLAEPAIQRLVGPRVASVIQSASHLQMTRWEADALTRGYYEELDDTFRFDGALWSLYLDRPSDWRPLEATPISRYTGDILMSELRPSARIQFLGKTLSTNRWGMRDRDYEQPRAPGVLRVAVLGSSYAMGRGVNDGESFEALIEARLNQAPPNLAYTRYEFLNFAVDGYSPLQQPAVYEGKVRAFQPQILFYVGNAGDAVRAVHSLTAMVNLGIDLDAETKALVARAGVHQAPILPEHGLGFSPTRRQEIQMHGGKKDVWASVGRQLDPWARPLTELAFRRLAELCKRDGVVPVFVLLPLAEAPWYGDPSHVRASAEAAGFHVIDLSLAFDGRDLDSLVIAAWDRHPNALGHAVLADALQHALGETTLPLDPFHGGETLMADEIVDTLRRYLHEKLLARDVDVGADTLLLTSGLISSIALVELVAFIEDRYHIEVRPYEMDVDHLDTLDRIAALIRARQGRR